MKPKNPYFLITCEHADYQFPKFIQSELPNFGNLKQSHQAYDKHALEMAQFLKISFESFKFKSDVVFYPYTRLLIDANRTPGNKGFHSALSKYLKTSELEKLEGIYKNYVKKCESLLQKNLKSKDIYILSIHSFTPIFKNKKRKTELGLLFRNSIDKEKILANKLKKQIRNLNPEIQVHNNLPYRGHTDCLSNYLLDKHLTNSSVNGLFLEFNQDFIKTKRKATAQTLASAFKKLL